MAADKKRLGASAKGIRARRGEFELRQRQLPADLHARNAAGRAWTHARDEVDKTPLGAPPKCVDVRSVYDARPINAFDFNIPVNAAAEEGTSVRLLEFQVPEGFVCVLRNFDIWFETAVFPSEIKSALTWTLLLNGGAFPYNEDVPFGMAVDRETVFMVADEFNTVGLRVVSVAGAFSSGTETYARFYGNFLLKTGMPAPLEIGNPTANCLPVARTAQPMPPRASTPPPKPEPPPKPAASMPAPPPVDPCPAPPFGVKWQRTGAMSHARSGGGLGAPPYEVVPIYDMRRGDESGPGRRHGYKLVDADLQKYACWLRKNKPAPPPPSFNVRTAHSGG